MTLVSNSEVATNTEKPERNSLSGSDSFFNSLPKFFESHKINANFKILKDGVFVDESCIEPLILAYQEWTKKNSSSGEGKSLEKCRKRLLGTAELPLYYALDGNRCLIGYNLVGEKADPRESKIPLYQGNLKPALEFVHQKDPFLLSLSSIKSRMSSHEGLLFDFLIGEKRIEVSEIALKEFASIFRKRPGQLRAYPNVARALRYVLEPMGKYLKNLKYVEPSTRLLIPIRFSNKKNINFFKSGELIFAASSDTSGDKIRLIGCYSVKGKSLVYFLRNEINGGAANSFELRGFASGSTKKHCLGKCWSQGITFHLNSRALIYFLRQGIKVPKVASKVPNHYSVKEILERFAAIFKNSKPVDPKTTIPKFRQRESFAKYRATGNWLYVITDKNVVSSCLYLNRNDRE